MKQSARSWGRKQSGPEQNQTCLQALRSELVYEVICKPVCLLPVNNNDIKQPTYSGWAVLFVFFCSQLSANWAPSRTHDVMQDAPDAQHCTHWTSACLILVCELVFYSKTKVKEVILMSRRIPINKWTFVLKYLK